LGGLFFSWIYLINNSKKASCFSPEHYKVQEKIYRKFTTFLHKCYILDVNFLEEKEEDSAPGNKG